MTGWRRSGNRWPTSYNDRMDQDWPPRSRGYRPAKSYRTQCGRPSTTGAVRTSSGGCGHNGPHRRPAAASRRQPHLPPRNLPRDTCGADSGTQANGGTLRSDGKGEDGGAAGPETPEVLAAKGEEEGQGERGKTTSACRATCSNFRPETRVPKTKLNFPRVQASLLQAKARGSTSHPVP